MTLRVRGSDVIESHSYIWKQGYWPLDGDCLVDESSLGHLAASAPHGPPKGN